MFVDSETWLKRCNKRNIHNDILPVFPLVGVEEWKVRLEQNGKREAGH